MLFVKIIGAIIDNDKINFFSLESAMITTTIHEDE